MKEIQLDSLPATLSDIMRILKERIGISSDVVSRQMIIGDGIQAILIYTDGLADPRQILYSLLNCKISNEINALTPEDQSYHLKNHVIPEGTLADVSTIEETIKHLFLGDSVIFLEGSPVGIAIGTRSLKQRNVEEPSSQSVVRGPREGFTESLRENTALIRRRIKDSRVRLEQQSIGTVTQTDVCIMYIEGIVLPKVLEEVRTRLSQIDIDSVLESNYIEEMIEDHPFSPFPTIFNSERPDAVAAGMLEGRIAIVVDGTPFVLLVPALFIQFFQSSEDYYQRHDFASMVRLLRFFCFNVAMLLPSLYIAITSFHQEMIPAPLLYSLISQREGIPFPSFVEAMIMELLFEILREAGVRLPKSIGQSVSIVGTLVIGQAAVEAGLVSAGMVIIVSITAISNFAIPAFNMGISVRMLRFVLMIFAGAFGLFGVVIGIIILIMHLCSLHSFGIPYMSSLAPFKLADQKDYFIRMPLWSMLTRPFLLSKNRKRMRKPHKNSG